MRMTNMHEFKEALKSNANTAILGSSFGACVTLVVLCSSHSSGHCIVNPTNSYDKQTTHLQTL